MRFRLVRYFTLASLGMFVLIAAAMAYFEHLQGAFFKEVQARQGSFFKEVQESFSRRQEEVARRDLLLIHESGNVNLTRLFANALWEKDFAPFVAKAQAIDIAPCRAIPNVAEPGGKMTMPLDKKTCFAAIGEKLRHFPEFAALDAKVFNAMKKSTVFKIKVYDLRGITVYSSEHRQMGEDKSANAGWMSARDGRPSSELTHRDKFSAFEGVVENRDLISSYHPLLEPGTERIVGVFEVYADVTPFLEQIRQSSKAIRQVAARNQEQVDHIAAANQIQVDDTSRHSIFAILGLLVLLFGALFAIIRRADRLIATQADEREKTQQLLFQAEKMASLGQMVAGVTHQFKKPLAACRNTVTQSLQTLRTLQSSPALNRKTQYATVDGNDEPVLLESTEDKATEIATVGDMLDDTLLGLDQMGELVKNLRDFTSLDKAKVALFDINKSLKNVAYIARTLTPAGIKLVEDYSSLPEISCSPSGLNQVFMNLIDNAAQAIPDQGTITVRSSVEDRFIRVDVVDSGAGIAPDVLPRIFDHYYSTKPTGEGTGLGLPIAKTIVEEHGGEIRVVTEEGRGSTFTVLLPVAA